MNLDEDIRIALPVQVPVMGTVLGGRCAWTTPAILPTAIRRVDPADLTLHGPTGWMGVSVYLRLGRVHSPMVWRTETGAALDLGLSEQVGRITRHGVSELDASVPSPYETPPQKRAEPTGRTAPWVLAAETLDALARDPGLLVHDGRRIYRAWRRGPLIGPGPELFEPRHEMWRLGYVPGCAEEHYSWCVSVNGSASRSAADGMARFERTNNRDLMAATPPDSDVLHFMERVPIELLGEWKTLGRGKYDGLGIRLRELAGLGIARALDGRDRFADLSTIREAASVLAKGWRGRKVTARAKEILAWCEAVAIPRVLAAPVPAEDLDAVSALAP